MPAFIREQASYLFYEKLIAAEITNDGASAFFSGNELILRQCRMSPSTSPATSVNTSGVSRGSGYRVRINSSHNAASMRSGSGLIASAGFFGSSATTGAAVVAIGKTVVAVAKLFANSRRESGIVIPRSLTA